MKQFILIFVLLLSVTGYGREVELNWEPFENALAYQIVVAKDSEFKSIVFKKVTKSPGVTLSLEIGSYFYKVRAVSKEKIPGYWSDPTKLQVEPYPPELKTPKSETYFSYFEKSPSIEFEWKPVDDNPEYEILIYKTTGKKEVEKRTKDTKIIVDTLQEGEYMWKARSIYKDIYESQYCEPRRFTIEKKELAKPILISPEDGAKLPAYKSFTLNWQRDLNARFSRVELQFTEEGKNKPNKIDVPVIQDKESHTVEYGEPGVYEWSVTTKETEDSPGVKTETRKFELRKDIVSGSSYYFYLGLGYASLDTEAKTTRFSATSEKSNTEGTGFFNHIGAGYFFSEGFGLSTDLVFGRPKIKNDEQSMSEMNMQMRMRMGTPGFNQQFTLGIRQESVYENVQSPLSYSQLFTTNGPTVGTELQGTVTRGWRFGLGALYYKPLGSMESKAKITGDAYEAKINIGYNPAYKFWVNYGFKYKKGVYSITPNGNPDTVYTKWESTEIHPFILTLSFEN